LALIAKLDLFQQGLGQELGGRTHSPNAKISGGQKFLILTSILCRRPLHLCVRRAKTIAQH
jgi:hypothetical protein